MSWGSKILAAGIVHKVSKNNKKSKTSWLELGITIFCVLAVTAFGIWAILR